MRDSGTPQRRAIVVTYQLSASPQKVWRALTEPALLETWLMPNDIAPIIGHRFTFRTAPAPGFDGVVHCEILDAQINQRLVYSWRGGSLDTIVTWVLAPAHAGGTDLTLTQDGFKPEDGFTYALLSKGWNEKAAGALAKALSDLD